MEDLESLEASDLADLEKQLKKNPRNQLRRLIDFARCDTPAATDEGNTTGKRSTQDADIGATGMTPVKSRARGNGACGGASTEFESDVGDSVRAMDFNEVNNTKDM